MIRRTKRFIGFSSCCLFLIGFLGGVETGIAKAETQKEDETPMVIYSDSLEVNDKTKVITFKGDVNAEKEDFIIDSQRMFVFYERSPQKSKGGGATNTKITKIVAEGGVVITSLKGGTATADQAVYYHLDEKIVLTGNAIAKQENDFVEGEKITIFLRENRRVVESSKEKRVRAVIFPGQEKR